MTLRYQVTGEDYFHYCMYSYDHSDAIKKRVLLVRLVYGAVILLLSLAILACSLTGRPLLSAAILWVVGAPLVANTRRSMRKTNEKYYRKQIKAGKGAEFIGDYTLELRDDAIVLSQPARRAEIAYGTLERIGQDDACLYVYCGSLSALILPLAAFRESGQKAALIELLESKCGPLPVDDGCGLTQGRP